MAKQYFVIAKETCPECGGERVICPNVDFYKRYYEFVKTLIGMDQHTYSQKQAAWIREQGFDPLNMPAEEVECPDCRGNGEIVGQVPLTEAIRELSSQGFLADLLQLE